MIIKRVTKTTHEITLPKPVYATLPSAEEIEGAEGLIGPSEYYDAPPTFSGYYYLRTPGEAENTIMYAAGDSVEDETDPDFDDPGPDGFFPDFHYGTGNRPLLVFEKSLYEAGCKPGDQFTVGWPWSFTVIGEKIALSNQLISLDIFDEETNVYEDSAIKKRVDEWFEKEIKPKF